MATINTGSSASETTELDRRIIQSLVDRWLQPELAIQDDRTTPESISPQRWHLVAADIRYLSAIIGQLVQLRQEAEKDEYGTLRATQQAFDTACQLLIDAAILANNNRRPIPRGCASTDSEGGIRIEWVRPCSGVHLVVPASAAPYVYHERGEMNGIGPATPESVAHWLQTID